MRAIRTGLAAAAIAAALLATACSQKSGAWAPVKADPAAIEAEIAALKTEVFQMKTDAATDIAPVIAALPKAVAVTYDSAALEPASGATLLSGVRITPADNTAIGVSIAQLRVWGLDAEFAVARLTGQRLDETASLARRIEATDIAAFGLETLMTPAMDAYTGAIEGAVLDAIEETSPDMPDDFDDEMRASLDMKLTDYKLGIARLVIDDLVLRPFTLDLKTLPPESELAEFLPIAQTYAAYARSFAADTIAYYDMTGELAMTQDGVASSISFKGATSATRGLRGGDADYAFASGITFDMSVQAPVYPVVTQPSPVDASPVGDDAIADDPVPAPPPITPVKMSGSVASYSTRNMRLDKLLGFLARGVMPPRTETDLLSAGPMRYTGLQVAMNGREVYSIGDATVEIRDFHWLIPTSARFDWTDVVYNVDGVMGLVSDSMAAQSGEPAADLIPPEAIAIMKRYGFDRISLDGAVDVDWKPKSGVSTFSLDYGIDDLLRFDMKAAGTLPTFKAVSDLVPADAAKTDDAAMSALFETTSSFKLAEFNLVDEGGLEKGFAAFIEFAALNPEAPGMAFVKGSTPASLRKMASSGIYVLSHEAAKTAPPAKDVIGAFAEWVAKGGAVHLTAKPKKPLKAADFQTANSGDTAFYDLFNFKAVHEPPKAAPAQ